MRIRLPDPDRRYRSVRLCCDLPLPHDEQLFAYGDGDGEWRLELTALPVARLEYELEVVDEQGASERIRDPANPLRVPGAFGEKSELRAPGYEPPGWLDGDDLAGRTTALSVRGRGLGARVELELWSPGDAGDDEPLPLLVAHDGPDYDALASLTRFAAVQIRANALPRHRVALLAGGARDEWYSASARYADALARDVLPRIAQTVAVQGKPGGLGASLGALALLHAERRRPGSFGALLLQSGSYFTPRFDAHESEFRRFGRIVRFVRATTRAQTRVDSDPIPITLTCGAHEENVQNNRVMAWALAQQGHEAALHELPDLHNFTAWRDAFDPHLTALLRRAWST